MANQVSINAYRFNGNTNGLPAAYGFPIQGCQFSPKIPSEVIAGITMNAIIKTPLGDEAVVAQTVAQLITAFT